MVCSCLLRSRFAPLFVVPLLSPFIAPQPIGIAGFRLRSSTGGTETCKRKRDDAVPADNIASPAVVARGSDADAESSRVIPQEEEAPTISFAGSRGDRSQARGRPPRPTKPSLFHNCARRCLNCAKINAAAVPRCSHCQGALTHEILHTDNMFTFFLRGKRATNIVHATKNQFDDFLVIDDRAPICAGGHLLCMPARAHIEDVRELFGAPREGLKLIAGMKAALLCGVKRKRELLRGSGCRKLVDVLEAAEAADRAGSVAEHAGLADAGSTKSTSHDGDTMGQDHDDHAELHYNLEQEHEDPSEDPRSIWRGCTLGFNCPPSQGQLHLTYAAAPWFPLQADQLERGEQLVLYRHVPCEYVERVLQRMVVLGASEDAPFFFDLSSLSIPDLTALVRRWYGISYEDVHRQYVARIARRNAILRRKLREEETELMMRGGGESSSCAAGASAALLAEETFFCAVGENEAYLMADWRDVYG